MKTVLRAFAFCGLLMLLPLASFGADPKITLKKSGGVLTLSEVIANVLLNNPELEAFSLEVRAREARALQAGLYKNPNLLFDVQDVFGSGDFKKVQNSQSTIVLSQVIELGGKRTKREREALLHKDLAFWDYETARMNILTRVAKAYTDTLTAQEKLKLARELVQLSQKPYNAVKAQVALSSTQIQLQQAENNRKAAYRRLATFWGSMTPRFQQVTGNLYRIASVPPFDTLTGHMQNNPDLARWAAEMVQRTAAVDLQEANAVPNMRVGAGRRGSARVGAGRRGCAETDDNSFVVEFSIPIPLFDRNQGGIAEARYRVANAKAEQRAVQLKLSATLATGYTRLANAHSCVTSLKTKILPGARTAFEAVNEGYRFGKFGYLEVLDSQRTWFNARSQFLDALAEYHKAVADVERLTGQAVSPVPEPRTQPRERERQR